MGFRSVSWQGKNSSALEIASAPELRRPPADPFVERVRKRERALEADSSRDDFHFIIGDG